MTKVVVFVTSARSRELATYRGKAIDRRDAKVVGSNPGAGKICFSHEIAIKVNSHRIILLWNLFIKHVRDA